LIKYKISPPCIQHGDTSPYCIAAAEGLEKRCEKKIAFLEKDVGKKNTQPFFPVNFVLKICTLHFMRKIPKF